MVAGLVEAIVLAAAMECPTIPAATGQPDASASS